LIGGLTADQTLPAGDGGRFCSASLVELAEDIRDVRSRRLLGDGRRRLCVRPLHRCRVLASRIMNDVRRTTVAAHPEAFRTLESEAERRGVPLTAILREAVEEKADAIRRARRPHVGVARSTDGRAARDLTAEPIAEPPR
jgi:hypothetical protein